MTPRHGGQQTGSGPCRSGVGDIASPRWVSPGCLGDVGLGGRGCPWWQQAAALVVDTTLSFTATVHSAAQSHGQLEAPHSCGRAELCTSHPLFVKLLSK